MHHVTNSQYVVRHHMIFRALAQEMHSNFQLICLQYRPIQNLPVHTVVHISKFFISSTIKLVKTANIT